MCSSDNQSPNHALQRRAAGRRGCNRHASTCGRSRSRDVAAFTISFKIMWSLVRADSTTPAGSVRLKRLATGKLVGFAICSFEKSWILVVPTTDNPYLASKVLSTPVKMVSRRSLVFLGSFFLAIAMFCVLWTLVRMALAGNRVTQSALQVLVSFRKQFNRQSQPFMSEQPITIWMYGRSGADYSSRLAFLLHPFLAAAWSN